MDDPKHMDEANLLQSARDELGRVLGFFHRVDAKASVVLAVDTGMLGFLAAKIPPLNTLFWWEITIAVAATLLPAASLWYLYKGAFPRLEGGSMSLVYFREIAKRTETNFIDEFMKQSTDDHIKDLLGQTWRNSEILKEKFDYLKTAFIFLALAILPWVVTLALFTLKAASLKTALAN